MPFRSNVNGDLKNGTSRKWSTCKSLLCSVYYIVPQDELNKIEHVAEVSVMQKHKVNDIKTRTNAQI